MKKWKKKKKLANQNFNNKYNIQENVTAVGGGGSESKNNTVSWKR